jgi:hypothetical protein
MRLLTRGSEALLLGKPKLLFVPGKFGRQLGILLFELSRFLFQFFYCKVGFRLLVFHTP